MTPSEKAAHCLGDVLEDLVMGHGRRAGREEWRAVKGYEGLYRISSLGRIYGPRRMLSTRGTDKDGYPVVSLNDEDGKRHTYALHVLVANAFHADKRNALHCEVAHLDGNRTNCRADNLKWVGRFENVAHKRLHGTHSAGEGNGNARLTEQQVREIRAAAGTLEKIGAAYGISPLTARDIRQRKRWGHVPLIPNARKDAK